MFDDKSLGSVGTGTTNIFFWPYYLAFLVDDRFNTTYFRFFLGHRKYFFKQITC